MPIIRNSSVVSLTDCDFTDLVSFKNQVEKNLEQGLRLVTLFATPNLAGDDPRTKVLWCLLADDSASTLTLFTAKLPESTFPAFTPKYPAFKVFEQAIYEEQGLIPTGHPELRYRLSPLSKEQDTHLYQLPFKELHEVGVGPVHAGIIEPGHFRFTCAGENVLYLDISLGYAHRGIEKALLREPPHKHPHYLATLAGDTTIGHSLAYYQNLEALLQLEVPLAALLNRGIALELERIANHLGDLGALAEDIGFLWGAAQLGRLRGEALNMTASLCGSRFARSLLKLGGIKFPLVKSQLPNLKKRLRVLQTESLAVLERLFSDNLVPARFEDVAKITGTIAKQLGLVGLAARASGLTLDTRCQHPTGIFNFLIIPPTYSESGDIFARAYVRYLEIKRSSSFIHECLAMLQELDELKEPTTDALLPKTLTPLPPDKLVCSLTEGWRGEICHIGLTNAQGTFSSYKIFDPSWHNWSALAYSMRGTTIADFPLANKSFNLSYCGHDL